MLFADVVGFSKLVEEQLPHFMHTFLKQIAQRLDALPVQPRMVNTWGDAIFAVMDDATSLIAYATALREVVCATRWEDLGLPHTMSIRIGVHAGPVFEAVDSITRRKNTFGSHVNWAARIEPVTLPGHIYASQQFVALLTTELYSTGNSDPAAWPMRFQYLGRQALAKNFGVMPVYSIKSRKAVIQKSVQPN